MKNFKFNFVYLAISTLAACGSPSGPLGGAPTISGHEKIGHVVVLRDGIGRLSAYIIGFDGKEVAAISLGEHIKFPAPEGSHVISIKCSSGWTGAMIVTSQKIQVHAEKSHYFVINRGLHCGVLESASEEEVSNRLKNSKYLPVE